MKKGIKITLIIIGCLVGIVLLDSLQALVFNNNPIIGIETHCRRKAGILVDTFHCGNGKNVTKFKTANSCPPPSVCGNEDNYTVTEIENVSISISDISLTGATITIEDTNETPYVYGEWYKIQQQENGKWQDLKTLVDNYGFNDIGYEVNDNKEVKFVIDWKWLYGELPLGSYRILKQVNNKYISIEFNIANTLNDNNILLEVKKDTITKSGATFILKNTTDEEYIYGAPYIIEKLEDENWKEIETTSPLTWNAIAYSLKAKEEKKINIDWSSGYGELKSGTYRLIKNNIRKYNSPESRAYTVYAEFNIK